MKRHIEERHGAPPADAPKETFVEVQGKIRREYLADGWHILAATELPSRKSTPPRQPEIAFDAPLVPVRLASECPQCSEHLVLRKRRSDGKEFLACSVRSCGFVENVNISVQLLQATLQQKLDAASADVEFLHEVNGLAAERLRRLVTAYPACRAELDEVVELLVGVHR